MQSSNGKNCTYIKLVSSFFETASGLSILFPSTSNGIPSREGLLNRSCSSFFEIRILSLSAASTTYLAYKKQACPIQELHSHSQTVEQNWSKFLSPNPCHVQYSEKPNMYWLLSMCWTVLALLSSIHCKSSLQHREPLAFMNSCGKNLHNGWDTTTVAFPHTAETWLATQIPQLYCYISLRHLTHIEAHLHSDTSHPCSTLCFHFSQPTTFPKSRWGGCLRDRERHAKWEEKLNSQRYLQWESYLQCNHQSGIQRKKHKQSISDAHKKNI